MAMITRVPEPNLWDVICKDFASRRPPFKDDDEESVHTHLSDFDPARHNPVFFNTNQIHAKVQADSNPLEDFDPAVQHPSVVGHAFVDRPAQSPPATPPPPPAKDKCSPREYLEHYIFPVLLPALEEMLKQAKLEKCFERKRTKFNALDFLTEYLYSHNQEKEDREGTQLADIPFVKDWWKDHPRPPLPKSLLWSEKEAGLIIQSFWRGYKVRLEPEVQELRQWQKEWREENENIHNKVDDFWAQQMPATAQGEQQEKEGEKAEEKGASVQESPRQPSAGSRASARGSPRAGDTPAGTAAGGEGQQGTEEGSKEE